MAVEDRWELEVVGAGRLPGNPTFPSEGWSDGGGPVIGVDGVPPVPFVAVDDVVTEGRVALLAWAAWGMGALRLVEILNISFP